MYLYCSWKRIVCVVVLAYFAVMRADGGETQKLTDLGYEALSKGDWDTALTRFDEAIRADSKNAAAYHGLGLAYGMKGNLDLAIVELTKSINLDSTVAIAYRSRGGFYLFKGEYDQAITDCDEAIRRDLKDSPTYNNRGFAYLMKGDYEKAIDDLTDAIRLDPKDTKAYANRGLAWYKKRDYDKSISDLSEAISIDKNNVEALQIRGGAYAYKGELEKALSDFNKSILLKPNNVESYRQRGSLYAWKGYFDQAIKDFSEAIRLNPDYAEAYLGRGNCYGKKKEYEKAITDINAAIKLLPDSAKCYELRGTIFIEKGEYTKGIADIKTAIKFNPGDYASSFESWAKTPITAESTEHGKRQLAQLLLDRPNMKKYGDKAKELYDWAIRKFSGEDFNNKIFWDSSEPSFAYAENSPSMSNGPGFVRVASKYNKGPQKGEARTFEEMWHNLIFELYNINNSKDFRQLVEDVESGKLTKHDFVNKILKYEWRAAEKTRSFYINVFLPWAKDQQLHTNPQLWYLAHDADSRQNPFSDFLTDKEDTWRHYEYMYNWIVLNSFVQKNEYDKAINLAEEMQHQAEIEAEQYKIKYMQGYCKLCLNRAISAISFLNESIQLNPTYADTYSARAAAYMMLRDKDHAMADYSEAIRLDPLNYSLYRLRGAAYKELGDTEKADSDFEQAKQLSKYRGGQSDNGNKTN
jgi:tetratricopeptide (TPR) repeat protein